MATEKSRTFTAEENQRLRGVIKALMERHGWGQRAAADALGVTQQMVSAFLSGRSGAGYPLAVRAAELTERDLDDLLQDDSAAEAVMNKAPDGPAGTESDDERPSGPEAVRSVEFFENVVAEAFDHKQHSLDDMDTIRKIFRRYPFSKKSVDDWRLRDMAPLMLDLVRDRRKKGLPTALVTIALHFARLSMRLIEDAEANGIPNGRLDINDLIEFEKEHPNGLTAAEVVAEVPKYGVKFSDDTLRKWVQWGLLPRSTRVTAGGMKTGSRGLYPAGVVRAVLDIKRRLGDGDSIEKIQAELGDRRDTELIAELQDQQQARKVARTGTKS